jgi:uncharacterized protein YbaR (Trm112 family)/SAM-dependent methyltransferase
MRRRLIELLACPECRGAVQLMESQEEDALRVKRGTLHCTACLRRYPIEKGVPQLSRTNEDIAETGRRFASQWRLRWKGRFEGPGRSYAIEHASYVCWMSERLQSHRHALDGDWILDAGCGSGEKTQLLARQCPQQNVVGLDLGGEALETAMMHFGNTPNLDYVQGNVLRPPLRDACFDYGISIGVLHCTPNTRQAFAAFRRLLKPEATLIVWIYPTYKEGPEWAMPYIARDFLFFRQGHRIPPALLWLAANLLVLVFYPVAARAFAQTCCRLKKDLPFMDIEALTWKERFASQAFILFDTCLPRYQFRHSRKEVESWCVEQGLAPAYCAHGYYCAATATASG